MQRLVHTNSLWDPYRSLFRYPPGLRPFRPPIFRGGCLTPGVGEAPWCCRARAQAPSVRGRQRRGGRGATHRRERWSVRQRRTDRTVHAGTARSRSRRSAPTRVALPGGRRRNHARSRCRAAGRALGSRQTGSASSATSGRGDRSRDRDAAAWPPPCGADHQAGPSNRPRPVGPAWRTEKPGAYEAPGLLGIHVFPLRRCNNIGDRNSRRRAAGTFRGLGWFRSEPP